LSFFSDPLGESSRTEQHIFDEKILAKPIAYRYKILLDQVAGFPALL
jgi:hypothetical protein